MLCFIICSFYFHMVFFLFSCFCFNAGGPCRPWRSLAPGCFWRSLTTPGYSWRLLAAPDGTGVAPGGHWRLLVLRLLVSLWVRAGLTGHRTEALQKESRACVLEVMCWISFERCAHSLDATDARNHSLPKRTHGNELL